MSDAERYIRDLLAGAGSAITTRGGSSGAESPVFPGRDKQYVGEAESLTVYGGSGCEGYRRGPTLSIPLGVLREILSSLDEERRVARRYRWVRNRLRVRNEAAVSGTVKPALSVRIGCSFIDHPVTGNRGYLDPHKYEEECREMDSLIDAAIDDVIEREDES